MGFIDVLVVYLIRLAIRAVKTRHSQRWPVENGTVTFSNAQGPVAHVGYTYTHRGKFFSGGHKKPFVFVESAKRYAAGLPPGTRIIVRVKAGYPQISIVRDGDQDEAAIKLRGRFE